MKQLSNELEIPTSSQEGKFTIALGEMEISITSILGGCFFTAKICKLPKKNREDIFIKVMEANLLGQGTGGSVISIDEEETFFSLSLAIGYDLKEYPLFKEKLEEFVNYRNYWKEEIALLIS